MYEFIIVSQIRAKQWAWRLFFHAHCFALHRQFDAVGSDVDQFLLVEVADGLLEDFLAYSKHGVDFFRWRFVVIGGETVGSQLQMFEQAFGEIADENSTVG